MASQNSFKVYANPIDPFPDVRIAHIAIDRAHTTASDIASYFPLTAMIKLAETGYIGSVTPRFYGLPTNRSQRTTRDIDSPALLAYCQEDNVDAVVLVPNCPVCHQSVALAAHCLETAGIATVIMGCAKDIIEYVGVPRLLFNDLPLGNAAGLPHDADRKILRRNWHLIFLLMQRNRAPQKNHRWFGQARLTGKKIIQMRHCFRLKRSPNAALNLIG